MKDLENNKISVTNFHGDGLHLIFAWDSDIDTWIEQFKTILYWVGFDHQMIEEVFVSEESEDDDGKEKL